MLLLSGVATARADLVPSPELMDFGYQAVNFTSAPRATTFRNTGDQPLTAVAVTSASGAYARTGGTCGAPPFTLAPQASCTMEHTFRPSAPGWFTQPLSVTLSGGSSVNFGLMGQGEVAYLQFSPPSLTFFPTRVGTIGESITVALRNTQPVPLDVVQISEVGAQVGSFVRTGGTCPEPPFTLGNCAMDYTFVPQAVGSATMQLYIVATSGSFSLPMSGEGTPEIPLFADGFDAPVPVPIP